MTTDVSAYFQNLLQGQILTEQELEALRSLRQRIEAQLSILEGNPRFYYAGSYGKKTMIRARYDLDLVIYWPSTANFTIKGIYDAVGQVLRNEWQVVNSKTVCWELPFDGGFHIDVVPGRALDARYFEANLHRTDTGTTLKTSLKTHIETVRGSGRSDAIKLMKLWKERRQVPFRKSFLLEVMTIAGCQGRNFDDYPGQILGALRYISANIETCNVIDPANTNNSLSDDLSREARQGIKAAADAAIAAPYWSHVFG
jgi:hypothetical protein